MPKLCEIIALVAGRKTEGQKQLTELHRVTQNAELFKGLARTYQPRDDADTEKLPPESKSIQVRSGDVFHSLEKVMVNVYDLIATQDYGNTHARGDVVTADGVTVLKDVPVTTLLYLEKQLDDLKKFYATLPVLDPAVDWSKDEATGLYKNISKTHRAKRKKEKLVLYEATKEHPAQVQMIETESIVGDWTKVETSAALTAKEKASLMDRVAALKDAVVLAREQANQAKVENRKAGELIFKYLHQGLV
jgi:hypothetical protein